VNVNQSSDCGGKPEVIGGGIVSELNLTTGQEQTPFAHASPHAAPPAPAPRSQRRARGRAAAVQALILAAVVAVVVSFVWLIASGLRSHGIGFSLSFLNQPAGFDISEGLTIAHGSNGFTLEPFNSQQTYAQALITGLYNTLVASAIAIVLSTALGVTLGVARMSRNWVVRNWAWAFVEFVRNTPLLIQLIFWYFAVLLQLPRLADASLLHGSLIASRQGVFIPWLVATPAASSYGHFAEAAIVAFALGWLFRMRSVRLTAFVASAGLLVLGLIVTGWPLRLDMPVASAFSVTGGAGFSPEMASLIIALTVYIAAFIAEVVRGAVGSIDKGQWEAAAALGLGQRESLWVVILPQAVRVILPSLGNLYVTLAKSTSFAIAIGFPDLFSVYGTVANQSGRALEGLLIIMLAYLMISFAISALANLYNRHVMRKAAR
jgi:general L-amino acid transport system permease protein